MVSNIKFTACEACHIEHHWELFFIDILFNLIWIVFRINYFTVFLKSLFTSDRIFDNLMNNFFVENYNLPLFIHFVKRI